MLDVFMIAQWCWCALLFTGKRLERTLILAGGALASGYTAYAATPWLTRTLIPATSPAFRWAMSEITRDPTAVNAISRYVPPEAATATGDQVHWITVHILLSLMFVAVTLSVFTCFTIVVLLREGLWDLPSAPSTAIRTWLGRTIGFTAAAYVSVITAVLLGNLSWLHDFAWLQTQAEDSFAILWIGRLVSHVI